MAPIHGNSYITYIDMHLTRRPLICTHTYESMSQAIPKSFAHMFWNLEMVTTLTSTCPHSRLPKCIYDCKISQHHLFALGRFVSNLNTIIHCNDKHKISKFPFYIYYPLRFFWISTSFFEKISSCIYLAYVYMPHFSSYNVSTCYGSLWRSTTWTRHFDQCSCDRW
jgi:hypothetical protein